MRMLEAVETQTSQSNPETLMLFDPSITDADQQALVTTEADPNIFERAVHLGHSALSYVRDRMTLPGKISRELAAGVTAMGGVAGLATALANAHPIKPMSPSQIIFAINRYEASALNGGELMNLRHEVLASHVLKKTGVCEKNNPVDPHVLSASYSLKGIKVVDCEKRPDGSRVSSFVPLTAIVSPPAAKSMDLTPVLDNLGSRAATSVGITSSQLGSPNRVVITNQPSRRTIEADVFYNNSASGSFAKKLKELKLEVVKGKERVQKLWYK